MGSSSRGRRLDHLAVDPDRERVRLDADLAAARRSRACRPCRAARVSRDRHQPPAHREPVGQPVVERAPARRTCTRRRGRRTGPTPRTSAAASTGCGVGIDALASPICAQAIIAALEHDVRPDAEEARVPQHEVGELADLDRADLAVEPVRDRRADRVLGDVAARPLVVGRAVAGQRAAPRLHRRARSARCAAITSPTRPIACESEPIIEIAPRSCSTSSAAIVVRPDAALGEREVLGHARVEVVADHQHVEVLVDGVDGVRPRRVGRRRQHVRLRRRRVMMSGAWPPPAPSVWYAWIAPAGDRGERRLARSRPR